MRTHRFSFGTGLVLVVSLCTTSGLAIAAPAAPMAKAATIDGAKIAYLSAGQGPPLILLHGYTQTSHMWVPAIPRLAERFSVIAPDLPGIGDSDVPTGPVDMKWAAGRIHELAKSLGIQKARVVGHDIGLMVAYAYAAQFPEETEKLVLMDAFLPGVEEWDEVYDSPNLWHFRFSGATPEALVKGRERTYYDYYWNEFAADGTRSLPEADRALYTKAYSRPGRMAAGWAYFVSFPKDAVDFAELAKTPLAMPVLVIAGQKSGGDLLGRQGKRVATDAKVVVLPDCGHWVLEEKQKETIDALAEFL